MRCEPVPVGFLLCAELVGREAETAALEAALSKGEGALILVLGEAGVGKSRLVREARLRAMARGRKVLFGRASDRSIPDDESKEARAS